MDIERSGQASGVIEPRVREIFEALAIALGFVAATRFPFMRGGPIESDEFLFVSRMAETWLPIHHTLFLTIGRAIGILVGGNYRGLVVLDMLVSSLALVSVWWWLRALVRPALATATTAVVGVAPLFWSLGEMAGNYTMIPLVGSFLLGVAYRGWTAPKPWHPFASAVVLALGTGYREDIGTFLLPVFFVIVWQHRWRRAVGSLALFTVLNLAWLVPMIESVGGLEAYRRESAEFAQSAGLKNSVFSLGFVDAPLRYAFKMALAFLATFGPGLIFLPRGLARLGSLSNGWKLGGLMALSVAPPLASHLMIHFGVAGYSFHYLPSMAALLAIGVGRVSFPARLPVIAAAPIRLWLLSGILAAFFLFFPADIHQPGLRGEFDLAVGRYTRVGLHENLAGRTASTWRTKNSVPIQSQAPNQEVDRSVSYGNE